MAYFSIWPCLNIQCVKSNPTVYCEQPQLVCFERFPPFPVNGSYRYAPLVAWITSICSGSQRQLLRVKGMRPTERRVRSDLQLNGIGSAFSAQPGDCVQTDLPKCKTVQGCQARLGLCSLIRFLYFLPWKMKQDSGQAGMIWATSVAFHRGLSRGQ